MQRTKELVVVMVTLLGSLFSSTCLYVFFAHLGNDKVVIGAVVGWVALLFSGYSALKFYLAEPLDAQSRSWGVVATIIVIISLFYGVILVLVG